MSRNYSGVAIFDLRGTLIITDMSSATSDSIKNKIVGGDKTVRLISQLQKQGVYVAVCTDDSAVYFEETAALFSQNNLSIAVDKMFNFDWLRQKKYPQKTIKETDEEYLYAIWASLSVKQMRQAVHVEGSLTPDFQKAKEARLDWQHLKSVALTRENISEETIMQKALELFVTSTMAQSKSNIYLEILKEAGFGDSYQDNPNVMVFDNGLAAESSELRTRAEKCGFSQRQLIPVASDYPKMLTDPLEQLVRLTRPRNVATPPIAETIASDAEEEIKPVAQAVTSQELKAFAAQLQPIVEGHEWGVADYCFFMGGKEIVTSDYKTKRVPHRVAKLHQYLADINSAEEIARPDVDLMLIKETLKSAIDHPKSGRFPETTDFYVQVLDRLNTNDLSTEWMYKLFSSYNGVSETSPLVVTEVKGSQRTSLL